MPEWLALKKNPSLLMGLAPFWCKGRAQRVAPPEPFRSQQQGRLTFLQIAALIAGSSFLPFPLVSTQRGCELYVRARMLSVGEF